MQTLRKLLTDQIKISERTNLVQARKFREALEKAMLGYTNKQITTVEMIAQLLELTKWIREAKKHGQELGLDQEEVAFYDALERERIGQGGDEIGYAAADGPGVGGEGRASG